jgi:hypothetical protein
MLSVAPEVGVAARLHGLGLLPEDKRKKFVETVTEYAVDGDDLAAMSSKTISSMFMDREFEQLKEGVRLELLPRLGDVRRNVESNYSSGEPPEEHMASLLESLDTLKEYFGEEEQAARIIERETEYANQWIGENTPQEPNQKPRRLGRVEEPEKPQGARSVFDDIDADDDAEAK